jgi:TonB family protein
VDFEILSDGRVVDVVVLASDPPFVFDRAALLAIQRWTYQRSPSREPFRHKIKLQFEPEPRSRYR